MLLFMLDQKQSDLDNLNVYELSRKFYEENKGKYSNYSEAMKAGEKYILENAPSQFDSTPLDTSDNMKKEGYEIKMTKKDGKWTIDTSSKNYELKDMAPHSVEALDTKMKGSSL